MGKSESEFNKRKIYTKNTHKSVFLVDFYTEQRRVLLLNPKSQKFSKLKEKSSREIGAFNKIVITKLRGSQGMLNFDV